MGFSRVGWIRIELLSWMVVKGLVAMGITIGASMVGLKRVQVKARVAE